MKNFLRKLHIGDSDGDGAPSPAPASRKGGGGEPTAKHASGISSWLSSVAGRPHPPTPAPAEAEERALASSLGEEEEEAAAARREGSRAEEGRKREIEKWEVALEEYHVQLALEMSAREDPEAAQIEVAKQISFGSCPLRSPAAVNT